MSLRSGLAWCASDTLITVTAGKFQGGASALGAGINMHLFEALERMPTDISPSPPMSHAFRGFSGWLLVNSTPSTLPASRFAQIHVPAGAAIVADNSFQPGRWYPDTDGHGWEQQMLAPLTEATGSYRMSKALAVAKAIEEGFPKRLGLLKSSKEEIKSYSARLTDIALAHRVGACTGFLSCWKVMTRNASYQPRQRSHPTLHRGRYLDEQKRKTEGGKETVGKTVRNPHISEKPQCVTPFAVGL